jgi:hypothetical protein
VSKQRAAKSEGPWVAADRYLMGHVSEIAASARALQGQVANYIAGLGDLNNDAPTEVARMRGAILLLRAELSEARENLDKQGREATKSALEMGKELASQQAALKKEIAKTKGVEKDSQRTLAALTLRWEQERSTAEKMHQHRYDSLVAEYEKLKGQLAMSTLYGTTNGSAKAPAERAYAANEPLPVNVISEFSDQQLTSSEELGDENKG